MDNSKQEECLDYSDIATNTLKGAVAGGTAGAMTGAILAGPPGAIIYGSEGVLTGAIYEGVSSLVDKLTCEYGRYPEVDEVK